MSPFVRAVLPAALSLALIAVPALAHEGDPRYRSQVRAIVPATPGLSAQVLDHDDALLVVNDSDRMVVILDEHGEPAARLLADGTVQVDRSSSLLHEAEADEATGDDDHADADGALLASADGPLLAHAGEAHEGEAHEDAGGRREPGHDDPTAWTTLDRTGRFQWHDPRINHREPGLPAQVTDREQETKVRDWRVPIVVGGERGAILGTLTWVGEPGAGSSFPTGAVVSLAVLALLGAGAVALVRRRRGAGDGGAA